MAHNRCSVKKEGRMPTGTPQPPRENGLEADTFLQSQGGGQSWQSCPQLPGSRGLHSTHRHKPGGLKTTGIYSLTVLEARSLKLGCQQGPGPSRGSRRGSVLVSLSFRGSRYFLACASITSVSTSDSPRPSLLLYPATASGHDLSTPCQKLSSDLEKKERHYNIHPT